MIYMYPIKFHYSQNIHIRLKNIFNRTHYFITWYYMLTFKLFREKFCYKLYKFTYKKRLRLNNVKLKTRRSVFKLQDSFFPTLVVVGSVLRPAGGDGLARRLQALHLEQVTLLVGGTVVEVAGIRGADTGIGVQKHKLLY